MTPRRLLVEPLVVLVLVLPVLLALPVAPASSAVGAGSPNEAGADPVGVWPLDPEPEVVEAFDPPEDPWGAGHRGVDLAGTAGQVVRSALPGTVAFAGSIAGKPVVSVRHGDRRTTYEPVVALVSKGDEVDAGDPIGRLVVPSSHCFPAACLHWGLIRGETYLDPLTLVGGGPIRLLPLWRDEPVEADHARPWVPPIRAWRRPLDALP